MMRVLLMTLVLMGCGRTALGHTHETLALGHMAHNETTSLVRAQLADALQGACGSIADRSEKIACGQEVAVAFRDREDGIRASAETVDVLAFATLSWARRVAAGEADEESPPVAVCEALSRLVAVIHAWARVGGEDLPIAPWECPDYVPEASEAPEAPEGEPNS